MMVTKEKLARAITVIASAGAWFNKKKSETGVIYKGAIDPVFHLLKSQGFIRSNGFDDEFVLTGEGRDFYSIWYSESGFNSDRQISLWGELGSLMRKESEAAQ